MPEIQVERIIPAPAQVVYELAKQTERLSDYLPDVESAQVLQREGPRVVSRWVGRVKQFNRLIRWVEEDVWDDAARRGAFRALEGDWDRYEGEWTFEEHPQGTRVWLRVEYDFDVPLIGPLIKGVLRKLVKQNAEQMLEGLERLVSDETGARSS